MGHKGTIRISDIFVSPRGQDDVEPLAHQLESQVFQVYLQSRKKSLSSLQKIVIVLFKTGGVHPKNNVATNKNLGYIQNLLG